MKVRGTAPEPSRNLRNALVLTVLIVLIAFFSPPFSKAGSSGGMADSSRSQQLAERVPKTPEELLLAIKGLIANKDEDGEVLCEQWLGIPRNIWKVNDPLPVKRWEWGKYTSDSKMFPAAPFHFGAAFLDKDNNLLGLELTFYRNPDFRMTPAVVQKIFGPPTKIWVGSPKNENSWGRYLITYRYDQRRENRSYYMDITFYNKDEVGGKIESLFRKHTPEQIQIEKTRRKALDVHQDYLPLSLELHL